MPTNKARLLVAQMARVWLAPVGTPAPVDAVIALAATWKDVGLFTPDSLSWATDPSFEEIRSHQSNYPTRVIQTGDAATLSVDLQEWSLDNFRAVYGGGTITTTGTAPNTFYRFAPPAIGARAQVSAVIEIIDGAKNARLVIPAAEQREGVETSFERGTEATLPLRLSVIGSDLGDPWYFLTNDAAFSGP